MPSRSVLVFTRLSQRLDRSMPMWHMLAVSTVNVLTPASAGQYSLQSQALAASPSLLTSTEELMERHAAAAESALCTPTVASLWITCTRTLRLIAQLLIGRLRPSCQSAVAERPMSSNSSAGIWMLCVRIGDSTGVVVARILASC